MHVIHNSIQNFNMNFNSIVSPSIRGFANRVGTAFYQPPSPERYLDCGDEKKPPIILRVSTKDIPLIHLQNLESDAIILTVDFARKKRKKNSFPVRAHRKG
jgi:hypothetical protein